MTTFTSPRSRTIARRSCRPLVTTALAGSLLVVGAPPASAHGNAETTTTRFLDAAELFPNTDPCTGVREDITATQSGVVHITRHADGHFQMGGTVVGEFTAVPVDPALPTYTGRFTVRFSQRDNANMDTAQFTNVLTAQGSDGSVRRFHGLTHITAAEIDFSSEDPADISGVKVAVERFRCG